MIHETWQARLKKMMEWIFRRGCGGERSGSVVPLVRLIGAVTAAAAGNVAWGLPGTLERPYCEENAKAVALVIN